MLWLLIVIFAVKKTDFNRKGLELITGNIPLHKYKTDIFIVSYIIVYIQNNSWTMRWLFYANQKFEKNAFDTSCI